MIYRSLSGRFLILSVAFFLLAECMIIIPLITQFQIDFLKDRFDRSQIAALALLTHEQPINANLESELLTNAGVYNIILRRDKARELVLSSPIIRPISATYDLRTTPDWQFTILAFKVWKNPQDILIRAMGMPIQQGGEVIEITLSTDDLRAATLEYTKNILIISVIITAIATTVLFVAINRQIVRPIQNVITAMTSYAKAPEDARSIISPDSNVTEIRSAQESLKTLQLDLTNALKQKYRLAGLGLAVAKINHDMRNILTSAQLFSDLIETSDDPKMQKMSPKLVALINRAIALCENTLNYGRAEEPAPTFCDVNIHETVKDIFDGEHLAGKSSNVRFVNAVPKGVIIRADPEQIYRIISNLVRNARQIMEQTTQGGEITVSLNDEGKQWCIRVQDNGPGISKRAQEHLFKAFQGITRKGNFGLGLAIAHELTTAHGGSLELAQTGPDGTTFHIQFPKI